MLARDSEEEERKKWQNIAPTVAHFVTQPFIWYNSGIRYRVINFEVQEPWDNFKYLERDNLYFFSFLLSDLGLHHCFLNEDYRGKGISVENKKI